jgi:hypothetical protein
MPSSIDLGRVIELPDQLGQPLRERLSLAPGDEVEAERTLKAGAAK